MESEENQTQVSLPSHNPWKSLRDSHIPTAPTTSFLSQKKTQERRPRRGSLHSPLQASCSMRICCPCPLRIAAVLCSAVRARNAARVSRPFAVLPTFREGLLLDVVKAPVKRHRARKPL